jgi:hypothetical protein
MYSMTIYKVSDVSTLGSRCPPGARSLTLSYDQEMNSNSTSVCFLAFKGSLDSKKEFNDEDYIK